MLHAGQAAPAAAVAGDSLPAAAQQLAGRHRGLHHRHPPPLPSHSPQLEQGPHIRALSL